LPAIFGAAHARDCTPNPVRNRVPDVLSAGNEGRSILPKAKKTCRSDVKCVCPEQGMLAPTVAQFLIAGMGRLYGPPPFVKTRFDDFWVLTARLYPALQRGYSTSPSPDGVRASTPFLQLGSFSRRPVQVCQRRSNRFAISLVFAIVGRSVLRTTRFRYDPDSAGQCLLPCHHRPRLARILVRQRHTGRIKTPSFHQAA